ncbi:MAG: DNA-binding protein [Acaryochloris sp. RU_4_1]|nr:DNA-binding protein [Acaryochloris sp. RU_4_1]NJR54168.1 DNA-binding protein [Acaryochloris sp. CRU_2_0]
MVQTLFLAWQEPNSRSWFPIGRLRRDGTQYQFVYTYGVQDAQDKCGFQALHSFPNLKREYRSAELFPLFSNRLMRPSRPDYRDYIEWLDIPRHQDDPIAILSRSGGRKATDTFEVFPCPVPDENGLYHIHFFSHRLRHLPECSVERISKFKLNERLYLANEFQNPYDPRALLLCTEDHHIVGYCPRYLVADALEILQKQPGLVHVHIERVNLAPTPLQFRLLCNMTAKWPQEFRPFSGQEYQPIVSKISCPTH